MEYLIPLLSIAILVFMTWLILNYAKQQRQIVSLQSQVEELKVKASRLEMERDFTEREVKRHEQEVQRLHESNALAFEQMATRILEDKSRRFSQQNQENIQRLLQPLGKELESFRNKVQETYDRESKERFSLERKVKELADLNQKISDEARNLTQALKGNAKVRGNWGEAILETILQNSGLERGHHYLVQEFLKNDDGSYLLGPGGKRMQPDITIIYPDKRKVLIDSKVSLVAYEQYFSTDDDIAREQALHVHLRAIRTHIEQLSSRQYESHSEVLDFVMMFVPMEAAYITAVQADRQLWEFAYNKRVLLISSSNLIAVLKMIKDLWIRDDQSRHAIEIAKRGGLLYDKFSGFVNTMTDVGRSLNKATESYDQAIRQLSTGKGNLISQADKLRKLGVAAKTRLPYSGDETPSQPIKRED